VYTVFVSPNHTDQRICVRECHLTDETELKSGSSMEMNKYDNRYVSYVSFFRKRLLMGYNHPHNLKSKFS